MEGIRLVGICRNLRDMTSQNFPASLIKNTGCKCWVIKIPTEGEFRLYTQRLRGGGGMNDAVWAWATFSPEEGGKELSERQTDCSTPPLIIISACADAYAGYRVMSYKCHRFRDAYLTYFPYFLQTFLSYCASRQWDKLIMGPVWLFNFFILSKCFNYWVGLKGLHGFEFPSAALRPPTVRLTFRKNWQIISQPQTEMAKKNS